jgi:hypothetical protein
MVKTNWSNLQLVFALEFAVDLSNVDAIASYSDE